MRPPDRPEARGKPRMLLSKHFAEGTPFRPRSAHFGGPAIHAACIVAHSRDEDSSKSRAVTCKHPKAKERMSAQ